MPISESIRPQLAPEGVVRDADYGRLRFMSVHGDSVLLLVTLAPDQVDVENALSFVASDDGTKDGAPPPNQQGIGFRTKVQTGGFETQAARSRIDADVLRKRLKKDRHFVVPVRKRLESASLSEERITIGRAFNQDVVLRHGSVSKFHAWMEVDDAGHVRLADAGSRNGTRVNDVPLGVRRLTEVLPGDRISFGSVSTLLCDAETLFAVVTAGK